MAGIKCTKMSVAFSRMVVDESTRTDPWSMSHIKKWPTWPIDPLWPALLLAAHDVRGRSHNALGVGDGGEILLYCVIIGEGHLVQCLIITHFDSDLASIFQQIMDMTAPKRTGMSEIPHPHAAHLPYLPEPRQWLWPFCMPISGSVIFFGGGSCFNLI